MLAYHSALIVCVLLAACSAEGPRNIMGSGCGAAAYNAAHNYFPDKVIPHFSKGFSVQYYSNFKVVTILRTQEQYVLVQRGTPQPEYNFGGPKGAFITVPIERAAVLSNAYFNYFELLGERRSIVVTTKHDYLNEPCLLKMLAEDGMLDGVTDRDLVSNNIFVKNNVDVIFRWSGSRDDELSNDNPALPPVVRVDTGAETTAAGMMEWIEYVSLFFNREREASRMVTQMKSRYDCIVSYVRPQPQVRVLYSSFSFSSSSSQVRCSFSISAWHKRMIEDVGGEVIGAYPNYESSGPCNMTALREHADTADVWLYKSNNFQEGRYGSKWAVKWNISSEVANFKPFLTGRTFDPNGNHFRDFWASRIVQLDVELEDLVKILHPAINYVHQRVWWLDVKTEVDPGQPTANQCKCKYSSMQLVAKACPGNPAMVPQGNLKPNSEYGCNGELVASMCKTHTAEKEKERQSGSHRPEPLASFASSLLFLVFVAKY